jgi:signal transduction histidine kinase
MDNAHRREVYSVARAYIQYRAQHDELRKANTRDDATYQFVEREILHGMRSRVGAIIRASSRGRTELSRQNTEGVVSQLESITENAERMRGDLGTIRDKIKQRYQAQDVSLRSLLDNLVEEHKTDCCFVVKCPDMFSVRVVPFKLRSLLNNVIDNAIKHGFTGTDGTIFMSASALPSGEALISVENDGAPMAPEYTSSAIPSWHVGLGYIKTLASELGTNLLFCSSSHTTTLGNTSL